MIVEVMRLEGADRSVPLPGYASAGAAGADLRANLASADRAAGLVLAPMERVLVPTGIAVALPEGMEMQVRPRSGLAARHGLTLVNSPGTVDADYRGEVGVLMINLGPDPVTVAHGERIAQAVIAPAPQAEFAERAQLSDTPRGTGGFGSTGRG